jgi:hypothetical protein
MFVHCVQQPGLGIVVRVESHSSDRSQVTISLCRQSWSQSCTQRATDPYIGPGEGSIDVCTACHLYLLWTLLQWGVCLSHPAIDLPLSSILSCRVFPAPFRGGPRMVPSRM